MSFRAAAAVLAVAAVLAPAWAEAQLRRPWTETVTLPPASIAAPEDAFAVDLNPAALALLEGWGLTYVHADAGAGDRLLERGDALYFGAPLPLGLGVGLAAYSVRPTTAAGAADRGGFALSLAGAPSRRLAIGATLRYLSSTDFSRARGDRDRITVLDLAQTWRPSSRVAIALVGRDLNGLLDYTGTTRDIPASFLLAAAVRPYGTDAFTLEAAGAVDTDGRIGVRAMAGLALPRLGRLSAVVELDDVADQGPDVRVIGGVGIDWMALGVGGGVIGGDGFEGGPGWYVSGHLRGTRREGLPEPRHALDLQVRGGLDKRTVLSVVRRLDEALHDERVAGVLVRLRSSDAGLAYAQELRLAFDELERAGKPVVCHVEAASGSEYYACAGASRTLIDPAGSIRLLGPSVDVLLLGRLLRQVGLRADFVRIGRYKSAVEQLTNERSSEPAREQRAALLDDVYRRLVVDLSQDLDVPPARVQGLIDRGPYAASEAVELDLVGSEQDELLLRETLPDAFGGDYPLRERPPAEEPRSWGVPPRIGVVVVDGNITEGDNTDLPIVEIHTSGGRTVSRAIERLAKDRSVRAIVLRVDSAGGSALASDQIWRAVRRARKRKPVVASLGAVAASGGYYVASAANEIWASPSTITGSIGIFFGKIDVEQLAEMVGVTVEHMGRGERAGADSIWRPFSADERAALADKIRLWYRLFLRRVAEGRGMEVARVHELGQGRVWTGDAALRMGLVDHLGSFGSALARARELGGLGPDAEVVTVPSRPEGLLDYVLGTGVRAEGRVGEGASAAGRPSILPAGIRAAASIAHAIAGAGPGVPLALMPAVVEVR